MNVAELVAKWGAQYINEGQTDRDIKKQLFEPVRADQFFRLIPETNTVYKSSYATMDDTLQAFTNNYHSKGTVAFKPNEIPLGEFKVNKTVKPDAVTKSWVGFLATLDVKERKNWPLIRWIIQQMIIPNMLAQYEKEVVYRGWKVTGYDGTPTVDGATFVRELASADAQLPANAAMDGIRTQIIRWEDEGRITPIATGAPSATATTWVEQVEAFIASIPAHERAQMDYLWMSEALYWRYVDGVREKYNKYYAQDEDLTLIKNSMVKVNWLRGMDNSTKIWCTPASNRVRPTKEDNSGRFAVEGKDIYSVLIATDFMKLLTFDVPEWIYTNDQENSITAGDITAYYS